MSQSTIVLPKKAIWSVIEKQGSYVAQVTEANSRARFEGWTVVSTDLTVSQATEWRDAMNSAQTPMLSDLFCYEYSETESAITEFDIISTRCRDGIWRTGSVVTWKHDTVWIEVGSVIYCADMEGAELVASADTDEWDLAVEYNAWLDEINEDEYEFSPFAGMVA